MCYWFTFGISYDSMGGARAHPAGVLPCSMTRMAESKPRSAAGVEEPKRTGAMIVRGHGGSEMLRAGGSLPGEDHSALASLGRWNYEGPPTRRSLGHLPELQRGPGTLCDQGSRWHSRRDKQQG